jgi:hypothetical protein
MVTSASAVLVVVRGGQGGVDGGRGVGQRGQPGQVGTQRPDRGREVVPAGHGPAEECCAAADRC